MPKKMNLRGLKNVPEELKKRKLVQLRFDDEEYQNMWEASPDTTQDRIARLIRRAVHEYRVKTIQVKINGEPVELSLKDARLLLRELAEKCY